MHIGIPIKDYLEINHSIETNNVFNYLIIFEKDKTEIFIILIYPKSVSYVEF